MKQFKNLTLAIVAGLLVLAIAAVSCKKKSSGTPAPTVTGFDSSTAGAGSTVTITGTNFVDVTSVKFGGTNAASYTVVNSTTITAVVGSGSTGSVTVTNSGGTSSKTGFTFRAPAIDGYANADSIGSTSLKAHWAFDGDGSESISGKGTLKTVGVSYVTGQVGQALQLTNGYLLADSTIANFGATATDLYASYSVSLWVNQSGTAFNATNLYSPLFEVVGAQYTDIWGLYGVIISNNGLGGDSLAIGGVNTNIDASAHTANFSLDPRDTASQYVSGSGWHLITESYDGPSQKAKIYIDGTLKYTSAPLATVTAPATFTIGAGGGPKVPTFGTAAFSDDFSIDYGWGTHTAASTRPWAAHGITATIDEVRVYNKVLTASEVTALHDFGVAGR